MNLTIEELKKVIESAIKEFAEAGKNGRDGYAQDEDDPVHPRGFAKPEAGDFTKESEEGNRYKRQGAANFGPYTSESAIRAIAKSVIRETIRESSKPIPAKKSESSAPYSSQAKIGEDGSVANVKMPGWKTTKTEDKSDPSWFDTDDMKKNKSKIKKKLESNILNSIYEKRLKGRK